MTNPMTQQEIEEARALADAASPGPWRKCGAQDGKCPCMLVWSTCVDTPVARATDEDGGGSQEDADFIAASRTLVPRLLAEVARLRAELGHVEPAARDAEVEHLRRVLALHDDAREMYEAAICDLRAALDIEVDGRAEALLDLHRVTEERDSALRRLELLLFAHAEEDQRAAAGRDEAARLRAAAPTIVRALLEDVARLEAGTGQAVSEAVTKEGV